MKFCLLDWWKRWGGAILSFIQTTLLVGPFNGLLFLHINVFFIDIISYFGWRLKLITVLDYQFNNFYWVTYCQHAIHRILKQLVLLCVRRKRLRQTQMALYTETLWLSLTIIERDNVYAYSYLVFLVDSSVCTLAKEDCLLLVSPAHFFFCCQPLRLCKEFLWLDAMIYSHLVQI